MKLARIEIVEDRTADSRCDEGFLKLQRLRLENVYADGSRSAPYPCDVVSRPGSDAVVAVLYWRDAARRIHVILRENPRAPIYLRRTKTFTHADPHEYRTIIEVVAGMVEDGDGPGLPGLTLRAAAEALEEAGAEVAPGGFSVIGGETFASPGTSDEKLYYCAAELPGPPSGKATGDGSVMEEAFELVTLELGDAIRRCRTGEIPDMKTELALIRLADHLGYVYTLGCYAEELPEPHRARFDAAGVDRRD